MWKGHAKHELSIILHPPCRARCPSLPISRGVEGVEGVEGGLPGDPEPPHPLLEAGDTAWWHRARTQPAKFQQYYALFARFPLVDGPGHGPAGGGQQALGPCSFQCVPQLFPPPSPPPGPNPSRLIGLGPARNAGSRVGGRQDFRVLRREAPARGSSSTCPGCLECLECGRRGITQEASQMHYPGHVD